MGLDISAVDYIKTDIQKATLFESLALNTMRTRTWFSEKISF